MFLHGYRGFRSGVSTEVSDMPPPTEPRVAKVSEVEESENSTPSDSSEEDSELRWHEMAKGPDVPSEYWHIQKLIKYMKVCV
jgi:hypothetical protein